MGLFIVLPDRLRGQSSIQFTLGDVSKEGVISGMPLVAITRPRHRINTPLWKKMNRKYNGEGFIQAIPFRGNGFVELKELVSRKFDF